MHRLADKRREVAYARHLPVQPDAATSNGVRRCLNLCELLCPHSCFATAGSRAARHDQQSFSTARPAAWRTVGGSWRCRSGLYGHSAARVLQTISKTSMVGVPPNVWRCSVWLTNRREVAYARRLPVQPDAATSNGLRRCLNLCELMCPQSCFATAGPRAARHDQQSFWTARHHQWHQAVRELQTYGEGDEN